MRIGIYFPKLPSTIGGGSIFEQTIFNALIEYSFEHEIIIFSWDSYTNIKNTKIQFINLSDYNEASKLPKKIEYKSFKQKLKQIIKKLFKKVIHTYEYKINYILSEISNINQKINKLNLEFKYKADYDNNLNRAVISNRINLLWFVVPVYTPVQVPFIFTVWDLAHRFHPYFPEVSFTGWTFEEREINYLSGCNRASYIVTGTQAGKEEIIRSYNINDEKVRVIPFPVPDYCLEQNLIILNIKEKLNIANQFLFYPAQFWPHKNHILFVQLLKILKEKYNLIFSVVFTGSNMGNANYIVSEFEKNNIQNCLHMPGFLPQEEIIELYHLAFALVYPSFFGPDNLPPLEAFALGCPVIASNFIGAREQLGDAALFANPVDADDFAQQIKLLYDNPKLRDLLIKRGKDKAMGLKSSYYLDSINSIADEFQKIRQCWSSEDFFV